MDVDRINANPLVARPTTEFWWSVTRPKRLDAFFMRGFETLPIRWTPPGTGLRP